MGLGPESCRDEVLPSAKDLDPRALGPIREAFQVLRDRRWLAPALEQEVVRLQRSTGHSFETCCLELGGRYRCKSRRGRNRRGHSIRTTIHALQAFASNIDPELTWRGGKIPPKLIHFLIEVLTSAQISAPSFISNPSKFRRLLCQPAPGSVAAIGLGCWIPRPRPMVPLLLEIELERQASRLFF